MTETLPPLEKLASPPELSLYRELLECLEEEWHALVNSREDSILAVAAQKEHLLKTLINLKQDKVKSPRHDRESLRRLKRRAAMAQARNHRLIVTTLETIQDFLGCLQSAPPGTYHAAGKVEVSPGSSFFHRQV